MQLNRDQWTKDPGPLPHETVLVPEIEPGGEAIVWTLNGEEKDEYDDCWTSALKNAEEAKKKGKNEPCPLSAIAVVFGVKDADGKRIFTTDDIRAISKKPGPALDRIWDTFARLNRLRKSDKEAAEKNSEKASNGDSTTGSQENLDTSTSS